MLNGWFRGVNIHVLFLITTINNKIELFSFQQRKNFYLEFEKFSEFSVHGEKTRNPVKRNE